MTTVINWDQVWAATARQLDGYRVDGLEALMTEDVLRFATVQQLAAAGISPADLKAEWRRPGVPDAVDLVVTCPHLAAIEFKYPREPSHTNAPWTQHLGEALKDFYRLAHMPADFRTRWCVQLLSARMRTYLDGVADRHRVRLALTAGQTTVLDPATIPALPPTAHRGLTRWLDDLPTVTARCVSVHHIGNDLLLASAHGVEAVGFANRRQVTQHRATVWDPLPAGDAYIANGCPTMKFSIGGGIGPLRVSQRIGLPGGSSRSRPGYFAQFETCTIAHRTAATEKRCGRKHVSPAQQAAAARAEAARQADFEKRRAAAGERRRAKFDAKHPEVAHASAQARAGRQTAQTRQVLVSRFHHLMARSALWFALWLALALVMSLWFLALAAALVVAFFYDWRSARRVLPPADLTPEGVVSPATQDAGVTAALAASADESPSNSAMGWFYYRASGVELADAFGKVVRTMGYGTLPKVERLDSRHSRFELGPRAGQPGTVPLVADIELVGPAAAHIVRVRWSTNRTGQRMAGAAHDPVVRANDVLADSLGGWLP
jgi:hypothetical protein